MVRFIAAIPVLVAVTVFGLWPADVCGQFCGGCFMGPPPSWSEQYHEAKAAVLAKWVATIPGDGEDEPGSTTYEIYSLSRSSNSSLTRGTRITIGTHNPGKPGQVAFLLGTSGTIGQLVWQIPFPFNSRRYNYVVRAPAADAAPQDRLSYYADRLEDSDELIAADAFEEVCKLPEGEIAAHATAMSSELLRKWLGDPNLPGGRIGLYSTMLGWCGGEEDVGWFYERIRELSDESLFRPHGIITGYLLLTGELGLDEIDQLKLRDPEAASFEKYVVVHALRYLWEFGDGLIAPERLKESVRLLLDQTDLSELAVHELAEWKDWSVQEKLRELYDTAEDNGSSMKEEIVRYMIASTKDVPVGDGERPGKHVTQGIRYLEELHKMDADLVQKARRGDGLQAAP